MAEAPSRDLELTRRLRALLAEHGPGPGSEFPCSYLPGRLARHVTLVPAPLVPGLYHSFMDLNFRRSGPTFYRPACAGCASCRMIRVPVSEFVPNRSQQRCLRRNADVEMIVKPPHPTEEKRRLFARYLAARHDGSMEASQETFEGFLYGSPLETLEVEYRIGERLVGAGLVDVEPEALSAVYFYFDPDEKARAPGVLNVLALVDQARRLDRPWLYLGYWVQGSRTMDYKAGYRPCEVLRPDGSWERFD
jgi:arginine-tRNA-protein transferase